MFIFCGLLIIEGMQQKIAITVRRELQGNAVYIHRKSERPQLFEIRQNNRTKHNHNILLEECEDVDWNQLRTHTFGRAPLPKRMTTDSTSGKSW